MTAAYIVWNADKTEGVIFVETHPEQHYVQTGEQDAKQALTGQIFNQARSSLAEAFHKCYEDEPRYMVETTAEILRAL